MRAATVQGNIRVTQRRVFVSEWTKLRSVRSTRWALLAAVVLTIGLAAVWSAVIASRWAGMPAAEQAGFNPLEPSMIGLTFAQALLRGGNSINFNSTVFDNKVSIREKLNALSS